MTDPGPRTRELLASSTEAPTINRDVLWARVRARQAVRARRRGILGWSMAGLGAAATATTVWLYSRATAAPPPAYDRPVATAADSLPTGPEPMVYTPQGTPQPEAPAPTALIPLLGMRTQLRMDIDHLLERRRDLTTQLDDTRTGPASRQLVIKDLADVEQQLAASRTALARIDAELAGGSTPVATTAPEGEHVTTHIEVPMAPPEVPVFLGMQQTLPWIAGGGALLVLMVMATLLWVRRVTRATLRELTTLRTQSGTQLTALSEGVEAIALEVERIGEGQRYLSKMIGTPNQSMAEQRPAT